MTMQQLTTEQIVAARKVTGRKLAELTATLQAIDATLQTGRPLPAVKPEAEWKEEFERELAAAIADRA